MFNVEDHGTIVLVRPLTADVRDWLANHTGPDSQWFGGALAVEPRYADELINALIAEGYAAQ